MNKIFKVIFNRTTQRMEVVSELTRSQGKAAASTDERGNIKAAILGGTAFAAVMLSASIAEAAVIIDSITMTNGATSGTVGSMTITTNASVPVASSTNPYNYFNPGSLSYDDRTKTQVSGLQGEGGENSALLYKSNTTSAIVIGRHATAVEDRNGTKASGVAIGDYSHAGGALSVAIGPFSRTSDTGSVALGTSARAEGFNSFAAMRQSAAIADYSAAVGSSSWANEKASFAMGASATALGERSFAIGSGTPQTVDGNRGAENRRSIYDGQNNTLAAGTDAFSIGTKAKTNGESAFAIGTNAQAGGFESNAEGKVILPDGTEKTIKELGTVVNADPNKKAHNAYALGTNTRALSNDTVAFSTNATAQGDGAISFGKDSKANGTGAIAFGNVSNATGANAISIGWNATSKEDKVISIGAHSTSTKDGGIAIGETAKSLGNQSVTVGYNSTVSGDNATAIGSHAKVEGLGGTSVGYEANAKGNFSTAMAYKSVASGNYSLAVGANTTVSGDNSGAFGQNNRVSGTDTFVLGSNVTVASNGSVILGNHSTSAKAESVGSRTFNGVKYDFAGHEGVVEGDYVSVGSADNERQIKYVAPGEVSATSTDAINGSQLYSAVTAGAWTLQTVKDGKVSDVNWGDNVVFDSSDSTVSIKATKEGRDGNGNTRASILDLTVNVDGTTITKDSTGKLSAVAAKVVKGTNIAGVEANTDSSTKITTYTINADGTTVSHADSSKAFLTVAKGNKDTNSNLTNYEVNLTTKAIDALGKAETALQSFTTSVNGVQVEKIDQTNNDINFVDGNASTARKDGNGNITFDVKVGDGLKIEDGKVVSNITELHVTSGSVTYDDKGNATTTLTRNDGSTATVTGVKNNFVTSSKTADDGKTATLTRNDGGTVAIDLSKTVTAAVNEATEKGFNITADNTKLENGATEDKVKLGEKVTYTSTDKNIITTVSNNTIDFGLNSTLSVGGKDGKDGAIGVKGADGKDGITVKPDAIVFNGVDGVNGKDGKDGADGTASIKVEKGPKGIDGNDGKDGVSKTRIVYEKPNGEKEEVATLRDGLYFGGDDRATDGKVIAKKLNEQMNITGGAALNNLADNNIGVVNENGNLVVKLAKDIDLSKDGSVTIGNTTLNDSGLNITNGPSVTNVGINAGDKKITNVSNGTIASDSKDAVNGSQLYQTNQNVTNIANTVAKGFNITADNGTEDNVQLGEKVTYTSTDKNIITTVSDNQIDFVLNSTLSIGKAGVDGKDGTIGVNGKDGSAVVLNGKDGSIGLTGSKGKDGTAAPSTNITVANGKPGVDGKDGESKTRIVYTNGTGGNEEVATLNDGLKFVGDDGKVIAKKLNDTLNVTGGITDVSKLSDNNIGVVNTDNGLVVKLAKEVNLTKDGSVTIGNTTLNDTGLTIKDGPSVTNTGINAGNKQITNVSSGLTDANGQKTDLANATQTNAVNVGDLKETVDNLTNATTGGFGLTDDKNTAVKQDLGKTIQIKGKDGVTVTAKTDEKALEIALAGEVSVSGKDGKDGSIGVKGADGKDGVTIYGNGTVVVGKDGAPGKVGINGKDGANATMTVEKGAPGLDGAKGRDGKDGEKTTRIVYTNETGGKEEVATLNDGLRFTGNNEVENKHKLNSLVTIIGEGVDKDASEKFKSAAGNINVKADGQGNLTIHLAKDVNLTNDGSLTIGNTTLNDSGLNITNGPSVTNVGINAGDKKITNVANGTISSTSKDAVNGSQLYDVREIATSGWNIAANGNNQTNVGPKGNVSLNNVDGNIVITKTDADNNVTFALSNDITIGGQPGKDGEPGKDGKIGVKGADGKDGVTIYGNGTVIAGKDGKDGAIGVKGADGKDGITVKPDAIVFNGVDGKNGRDGRDGETALKVVDGAKGIDGNDGKDGESKTRIEYKKPDGTTEEIATLNDGLYFGGDDRNEADKVIAKKLNQQMNITGGADLTKLVDNNIGVVNTSGNLVVKLSKDINLTDKGSVTIGNTTLNDAGLTITGGPSVTNVGINAGDKKITNVANGTISSTSKDAVNGSQLYDVREIATSGWNIAANGNNQTNVGPKGNVSLNNVDGNIVITKTDADNNVTFALSNDITIGGQPGKDGEPGKDGKIGVKGADGKDGVTIYGNGTVIAGKDGKDGAIGVKGADGKDGITVKPDAIVFNGVDGKNGRDGRDGETALKVVDGAKGIDGNDGKDGESKTRIEYKKPDGTTEEIATLNDGLYFGGDDRNEADKVIAKKLNQQMNITGGADLTKLVDNNIGVVNTSGNLVVKLSKDINLTDKGSVTIGNTTLNDAGLTITGGPSVTNVGINAGDKKITNVANGTISADSKDAVNGSQLYQVQEIATAGWHLTANGTRSSNVKPNHTVDLNNKDGNIQITKDGHNVTFGLSKDLTVGKDGKDGQPGEAGSIGVKGQDGKDGISIKGDTGANGQPGEATVVVGRNGKDGDAGIDGKVGVNGKDGASVVLNGKDGSIGLTGPKGKDGKDGLSTNITVQDGAQGVNGTNGANGLPGEKGETRVVYTDGNGTTQQVANLNDGLIFTGNNGELNRHKLNSLVTIIGEGVSKDASKEFKSAAGNINVKADGEGNLTIQLNRDLKDLGTASFVAYNDDGTVNNDAPKTNITNTGLTVTPKDGVDGKDGNVVSVTDKGLNNGGNQIVNVKSGIDGLDGKPGKDGQAIKSVNDLTDAQLKEVGTNGANINDVRNATDGLVNKGFNITADNMGAGITEKDNVKLGETVKYTSDDKNIVTTVRDNEIDFGLANDLSVGKDGKDGQPGKAGSIGVKGQDGKDGISIKGDTGENGQPGEATVTVGRDGKDGDAGIDGKVGVNGKDGSAVVLNGKDGSIGLNGKDGKDGLSFKSADGAQGVDGKDGKDGLPGTGKDGEPGKTRIVYQPTDPQGNPQGEPETVATLNDGLIFTGNNELLNRHKLNTVVKIIGEGVNKAASEAFKSAAGNINVVANEKDELEIKLNRDLKDLGTASFVAYNDDSTVNNEAPKTNITNTGLTITPKDGKDGKDGNVVSVTDKGLNNGGNQIVNVKSGIDGLDGKPGKDGQAIKSVNDLTDAQLKEVGTNGANINDVRNATDGLINKGFNITADNKDLADAADKDNVKLGETVNYTSTDKNIVTTVRDNAIDFGLANELSVGKDGKDGQPGKAGSIGVKGQDGKDGISIKGDTGANGQPGEATVLIGRNGKDGDAGIDGKVGVNGKDGSAVVLNGKDGSIGLNGKDGKDGLSFKSADGAQGVDGTNGKDGLPGQNGTTRIVYQPTNPDGTPKGNPEQVATLNDGLIFTGNNAVLNRHKLNTLVTIIGEGVDKAASEAFKSAAGNINVKADGQGNLTVQLNKDVNLTNDGSLTIGNTTLNDGGLTINNGPSVTNTGINAGDKKITKVANGTISSTSTDAVNGSQLYQVQEIATAGWHLTANGTASSNVKPNHTVDLNNKDGNIQITKEGHNVTFGLNNNLTVGGKDGKDGAIGVKGADGNTGVTLNGKDGTIGINGKDGTNGTITFEQGKPGVDGKDGETKSRIVYETKDKDGKPVKEEVATLNDGLKFVGDDGKEIIKKLNETLKISGGETDATKLSDANNIGVVNNNGTLTIKLAKDIDLTKDGSVTVGNTTISNDGLTITGGPSVTNTGINAGDKKITNVANGTISADSKDAVNGSQLYQVQEIATAGWHLTANGTASSNVKPNHTVDLNNKDGNIQITKEGHNVTFGLNNNLTVGGKDGKDGAIGVAGKDGKDGVTIKGDGTIVAGRDGKDGVDGKIGVNGKDGASVVLNGKDGSIGLTGAKGADGKDGASANISVKDGAEGVNGTNGKDGLPGENGQTRIVYETKDKDGKTITEQVANLNDGLIFTGNNEELNRHKLNTVVKVVGEGVIGKEASNNFKSATGNINVKANGSDTLEIQLAKNVDLTTDGSVTIGDTHINNDGLTINNGPSITKNGIDAKGTKITNVKDGDVTATSKDAVNGSQLYNAMQNVGWDLTVDGNVAADSETGSKRVNNNGKVAVSGGKNIVVSRKGSTVEVATSSNPEFDTVKVGGTTISSTVAKDGVNELNVAGNNGAPTRITNVAPGVKGTDAVNVNQLKGEVNNINNRIGNVDKDLRAGIAGALAAGNLYHVTQPGKSMLSAGAGTYRGQGAVAVGYSRLSDNGKVGVKFSINSDTRGHAGAAASVGYQW